MNKAVSWRIKGVDFDARDAAMEAARRSGMSLGEWLNKVIAEQAAEDGVSEDDYDSEDRREAVARRLSRMGGQDDRPRRDQRRSDSDEDRERIQRARARRRAAPERDGDEDFRERSRRDTRDDGWHARPRASSRRESFDPEALLEGAISAFEQRASRSNERTARALADVADLIETNNRKRRREDTALATISDRLSQIERRVTRAAETSTSTRPLHEAMERLEERIDRISRRPEVEPATGAPRAARAAQAETPSDARIAEIEAKLAAITPSAPKRPLASMIAEVAKRQRELDGDGVLRPTAFRAESPPVFDAIPSPAESRLKALVDRLEKAASPSHGPITDLSGLQGNITALTDRIEQMRGDIAARAAARDADNSQIAQIRSEVAAMARAVADLAPRTSIASLDSTVRDMAVKIENSRMDGVGEAVLAPIESLMRDVRAAVKDFDPRTSIVSLEREIRSVAAKLENFDGGAADAGMVKGIFEQTRELRDILHRILASQLPSERVERELATLADRIDVMAVTGIDARESRELADRVSEIRSLIADPSLQGRTLQAIEMQLESIAQKIDSALGARFETMQRAFSAELDQVRSATGSGVPADFATQMSERIDTALGNGLIAMQRAISRALETAKPQLAAGNAHLEDMMRDLVTRIDAVSAQRHDDRAVAALQTQIERMSGLFDRTSKTADTLVSLEHSVGELFARLDQTKHESVAAAESAARRLVANGDPSSDLGREVADLRSLQDSSDHRTHETLSAVHETLERVVERLSTLEDDLADVRHTRPAEAPRARPSSDPVSDIARALQDEQEQFSAARARASAPAPDSLDSEVLIEPGAPFAGRRGASARSELPAAAPDERLEYRPQASFIQAARRAAQAAAAASTEAPAAPPRKAATPQKANAPLEQVRAYYESRKRPILLSLAALMVIVGAWQIGRFVIEERMAPEAPPPVAAPKAPVQQKSSTAPEKALAPAAAPASAPVPSEPAAPPPGRKADAPPAMTMPPGTVPVSNPSIDRSPVSSIAPAQSNVDTTAILRALAQQGDSSAQYELGVRYADGKLVQRDLKLASEWFQKAAVKGLAPAQYRLGAMYERGLGIARDATLARNWYQRAADQGNARAMHNLGVLLADGSEGKPNYADAIGWFKRASEFGIRDSQFNLAILYARGLGTAVDYVQSYVWFAAAAAQGDDDSAKKRDDVAGRLQPADLARAKAQLAAFKPKTPDPAANDVQTPPGGWEAMKAAPKIEPRAEPKAEPKANARPKISNL